MNTHVKYETFYEQLARGMDTLRNRRIVITGANHGIGLETARMCARAGAHVMLAVRSIPRGERAVRTIVDETPGASVSLQHVYLSDLDSVRACAARIQGQPIDILLNNAGVMIPPRTITPQGWELQIGCNHLGHFALTGLLLPSMQPDGRIVTVSSIASKRGKLRLDNADASKGYNPYTFYCQSKLMNYIFGVTLHHKLRGTSLRSIVCHPGVASTNLLSRGSGKESALWKRALFRLVGHDALHGAYPLLSACTNGSLRGGEMVGPDGPGGRKGLPFVDASFQSLWNERDADALWEWSQRATGVTTAFQDLVPSG